MNKTRFGRTASRCRSGIEGREHREPPPLNPAWVHRWPGPSFEGAGQWGTGAEDAAEPGTAPVQTNISLDWITGLEVFRRTAPRCGSGTEARQNRDPPSPNPASVPWTTRANFRRAAPRCGSGIGVQTEPGNPPRAIPHRSHGGPGPGFKGPRRNAEVASKVGRTGKRRRSSPVSDSQITKNEAIERRRRDGEVASKGGRIGDVAASHPDKIPSSIPLWTNFSNSSM